MAAIGASDVTYTIEDESRVGFKPRRCNRVKVVFGDGALTYPSNGVPLTATKMGLPESVIESVNLIDTNDASGIVWKYDFANNKLRGYEMAFTTPSGTISTPTFTGTPQTVTSETGPVIVEEVKVVATDTATLKHLPAHIWLVEAVTAGTAGPKVVTPTTDAAIAAGSVKVDFATGVLTFAAADTVTRARVSYLPKFMLLTASDLVVEETVTQTANVGNLANNACLISVVFDNTNQKEHKIREKGIAAGSLSANQCSVDFTPGAGNTEVTDNDTDDAAGTASLRVTYVKAGAQLINGQVLDLVEEEAVSLSSEVGTCAFHGIPSTGTWLNATAGTAGPAPMVGQYQAAPGTDQATWAFGAVAQGGTGVGIEFKGTSAVTACKITYVKLVPDNPASAITVSTPAGTVSAPTFTGAALSDASLSELDTSDTPAAQTLYIEVIGY